MFTSSKNVFRYGICLSLVLILLVLVTIPILANIKMSPYVQNVTTSSIYVLTECDSTATATVKYGLTISYGSTATTDTTEATNGGNSWVHNVKLTGLAPNTLYHYQVLQGTSTSADATFYTAVNPGTGFRFALMGDSRSNASVHGTIASRIKAANPRISLYPGDLCIDSTYSAWKNEFFVPNELALDASAPFYNGAGNHEGWNTNTYAFTHGSGTNRYYSFDYGDAHVLVLANYGEAYGVGSPQYNFAMSDLQASAKPWKIVVYHNPAYTYSNHGSDTVMQAYANNIFIPNGVAMCVAGHNHCYERITLNGLKHITMGGGGAPLYAVGSGTGTDKSESTYCYGIVDVTATTLSYTAYRSDGSTLDSFSLNKGPAPTPTPMITPTPTTTPTPNGLKVHFKNNSITNWTTFNCYYWGSNGSPVSNTWPGNVMTSEGNNWYVFTVPGATSSNVIFDNGSTQTVDLSRAGEGWFVPTGTSAGKITGTWYNSNPDTGTGLKVHFKNNTITNWSTFNCYYWSSNGSPASNTWPGQAMTSEGNSWYYFIIPGASSSNVIFDNGSSQTVDLSRTSEGWFVPTGTSGGKITGAWYNSNPG